MGFVKRLSWMEWIGILILTIGLAMGAYYWKNVLAPSETDGLLQQQASQVQSSWDANKTTIKKTEPVSNKQGDVIGVLHIPRWGKNHSVPIVNGTTDPVLKKGVGRYMDSAIPGEIGNLAIAGHRSGDPQPFRHLLELEKGDLVIVETPIATYTYKVTKDANQTTLQAKDGGWVIHAPEVKDYANKKTITLTTCTHLYRSSDRSVLFGELVETVPKS